MTVFLVLSVMILIGSLAPVLGADTRTAELHPHH